MGRIAEKSVKWEGLRKMEGCSNKKGGMRTLWEKRLSKKKENS